MQSSSGKRKPWHKFHFDTWFPGHSTEVSDVLKGSLPNKTLWQKQILNVLELYHFCRHAWRQVRLWSCIFPSLSLGRHLDVSISGFQTFRCGKFASRFVAQRIRAMSRTWRSDVYSCTYLHVYCKCWSQIMQGYQPPLPATTPSQTSNRTSTACLSEAAPKTNGCFK